MTTPLPESLVQISLRNNSLSGFLTSETFKGLNFLQVLDLSYNIFSGSVPIALFHLPSLQQLKLSFNQLSSIESSTSSLFINPQSEMIAVDLSNNWIQGILPSFLGLMPKLSSLSLENNKFSLGEIKQKN